MSIAGHLPARHPSRAGRRTQGTIGEAAVVAGALLAAAILGIAAGVQPLLAGGAIGLCIAAAVAFAAPVAHLTFLLAFTAIVPYSIQQQMSFANVGVADVLLLTGLLRAVLVIATHAPEPRRLIAMAVLTLFLAVAAVQTVRGVLGSDDPGQAAYEGRILLSWCTLLIAMPIVADPVQRRRLLRGLLMIGLALGLWGLVQWQVQLPFDTAGDAGVRKGVELTTSGKGQVQGGLFAFPLAALMAFAALISGSVTSGRLRALLVIVLVLNTVAMLLTFERSFWVASVLGLGLVLLRASGTTRLRAVIWLAMVVALALPILATAAPGALGTARERLLSLGQYGSDRSVRFRVNETRHVVDRIRADPILGSGTGATIHWGRPYEQVLPQTTPFAHNALLWLSWKAGIPAAILLLVLVVWAIASRAPPVGGPAFAAVRGGAQAGLLVMLVVSVTFPSFVQRPITAVLGTWVAICLAPARSAAADQ